MAGPHPRARAATATRAPEPQLTRAGRGERRLRALVRLAIPERIVPLAPAVEPCARDRAADAA